MLYKDFTSSHFAYDLFLVFTAGNQRQAVDLLPSRLNVRLGGLHRMFMLVDLLPIQHLNPIPSLAQGRFMLMFKTIAMLVLLALLTAIRPATDLEGMRITLLGLICRQEVLPLLFFNKDMWRPLTRMVRRTNICSKVEQEAPTEISMGMVGSCKSLNSLIAPQVRK